MSKLIVTAKLYGDISDNVVYDIRWLLGFERSIKIGTTLPDTLKRKQILKGGEGEFFANQFKFYLNPNHYLLTCICKSPEKNLVDDFVNWLSNYVESGSNGMGGFAMFVSGGETKVFRLNTKKNISSRNLKAIYTLLHNTKDSKIIDLAKQYFSNIEVAFDNEEDQICFQKIIFKLGGRWKGDEDKIIISGKMRIFVRGLKMTWGLYDNESDDESLIKWDDDEINLTAYCLLRKDETAHLYDVPAQIADISYHICQEYYNESDRHKIKNLPLSAAFLWDETEMGSKFWNRVSVNGNLFENDFVFKASEKIITAMLDSGCAFMNKASNNEPYVYVIGKLGAMFHISESIYKIFRLNEKTKDLK